MSKVKYISSPTDIPAGQNYVMVMYGPSKTISDLSFLTAVHSAKGIAKKERISTIIACQPNSQFGPF
jgi:hypothetical protein